MFNNIALTGVYPIPMDSSPNIFARDFDSHDLLRDLLSGVGGSGPEEYPKPILPKTAGIYPSRPATYTKRPEVNVVALSAPKHDALTIRARTRAPMGPNTLLPNCTATVFD